MNQTSRAIHNSSSTHLFDEFNFQLKFDSFGSWTKFNESIIESSSELFSSWFGSLSALRVYICSSGFLTSFHSLPSLKNKTGHLHLLRRGGSLQHGGQRWFHCAGVSKLRCFRFFFLDLDILFFLLFKNQLRIFIPPTQNPRSNILFRNPFFPLIQLRLQNFQNKSQTV